MVMSYNAGPELGIIEVHTTKKVDIQLIFGRRDVLKE